MRDIRRLLACLLCLLLTLPALAEEKKESIGYQAAHRFTLQLTETKRYNGSQVHLWQISTSQKAVDTALNTLAKSWADEAAPTLKAPVGDSNSRVEVAIRPSRTGLSWMSFLVLGRTVYHEKTETVRFETATYDMETGEELTLADLFPADSEAWPMLEQAVRDGVNAYYPEETANAVALDAACAREAIEQMDFTLHGGSLVLHLHAQEFYPDHPQLIEVTLYYPDIRPLMTEEAARQTNNGEYYHTIALTYDDGPNGWTTRKMLDTLLAAGERATFFLVGERMAQQSYFVQREHDEGHTVASHNWKHVYANETAASQLKTMPEKVNAIHEKIIGIAPLFCRPPGGQWRNMAEAKLGWPLILWSVDAEDWRGDSGPDPKQTAGNITAGATDGGIILMHDLKRNSIEASRMFIERLQEKGYIFLTVDELFAMGGVALEPDTPYWRCQDGVVTK